MPTFRVFNSPEEYYIKYFEIGDMLTKFKHLIINKNTKIRKSANDKFKCP